jgi:hypothetical protein
MCNVAHASKKQRRGNRGHAATRTGGGAMIRGMRAAAWGTNVRSCRTSEWKRQIAAWLVILLALVTFETGRHSVHHIDDDDDLAACVVACAATNVPVAEAPPVTVAPVPDVVRFLAIDGGLPTPSTHPLDVREGRGPPRLLSA